MKESFVERLARGVIVCDGPLDTSLLALNHRDIPIDLYNLTQPVVIEQLHRDYVNAGAEIIQTNTARANRIVLSRYKLDDKVYEINRKGVWLARTAAVNKAYVAGVIGPTRRFLSPVGKITTEQAREAFVEQATALLGGGAELIFLKSFIDLEELLAAVDAVRAVDANIPIVAHKTFPEDGAVLATAYPATVAQRLADSGVLGFGSDSTVGPQRMLGILQALWRPGAILSAQPDASIPVLSDDRPIYHASPSYIAAASKELVKHGATIVGISGGATPALVQIIRQAVEGMKAGEPVVRAAHGHATDETAADAGERRSAFGQKIARGEFVTTVELDIPRGFDLSSVIAGATYLRDAGVDAVNITDGARARLRMGSIAISHEIMRLTGMESITHIACRDRNMVALQSDLQSAWTLGIKNILAITGDPTHIGDFPYSTSVYDVDSIGLIRGAQRMNAGEDIIGNPIGASTAFTIGCAANPLADDMERELDRLRQKIDRGANVIFTQPVYQPDHLERFMARVSALKCPVVLGILPLRTWKHAEFLHHEVPGIVIPEPIQDRMARAGSAAAREGVAIAVEFAREARSMVQGFYLLPPFKKYDMAVEILQQVM